MSNNSLFVEKSICFDKFGVDIEKIPLPLSLQNADAKFGILNFKATTTDISQKEQEKEKEQEFLFLVDCSASMSDGCSDNRNKMQHIVHTIKNMILFFNEHPSIKVNVTITAFDDKIHPIVERTFITEKNLENILNKVDTIRPKGFTDIENALKYAHKYITNLNADYPNNNINHIFMTDGEATAGSHDHNILRDLVNKDVMNAFIGFGINHDSSLLNFISSDVKSCYYFIDKIESSGLVYGEILHGIVYKLLTNTTVSISNGLIYDFKNNEWVSNINIGDIVSEASKTFHIVSDDPRSCTITIHGTNNNEVLNFDTTDWSRTYDDDLTKYVYRQRTLQLLYVVNEYLTRRNSIAKDEFEPITTTFRLSIRIPVTPDRFGEKEKEQEIQLKSKLRNLIEEMKRYMEDNNLKDDSFMRNLCDDIYICHRTFGTRYGAMYTSARQRSQGAQRGYNVSQTPDDDIMVNPRVMRAPRRFRNSTNNDNLRTQSQVFNFGVDSDDDSDGVDSDADTIVEKYNLDDIQHEVSDFAKTPYLTPQATQVMRAISGSVLRMSAESP